MISLQVNNLTKKFNRHTVFKDLNFEHRNGILGIAGPNGSGKSTLIKCLAYLLRPSSGEISWNRDQQQLTPKMLKAQIGYAAPYISLYDELTVLENLRFLVEAGGDTANMEHLQQLTERVQVSELTDQLYGSLSTGQQQRCKLAAALVRDPNILMLDEPGSNLDKKGHELVSSIVHRESEKGRLLFLASNDPSEIALCDEVIHISI